MLDFIEELNKKGIEFGEFIVHSNENCPYHQEYIDKGIPDLSTDGWDLPAWASWELMVHIGVLTEDEISTGKMILDDNSLEAHIGLQSPKEICKIDGSRKMYSITIQHEMKHYFDGIIEFNKRGKINNKECKEINKLRKKIDKMDYNPDEYVLIQFFTRFFYMTSETEMSAKSHYHI